jgi:hypothetical protein
MIQAGARITQDTNTQRTGNGSQKEWEFLEYGPQLGFRVNCLVVLVQPFLEALQLGGRPE